MIRRFIDPAATFRFVAAEDIAGIQQREGARGFDAPGATYPHRVLGDWTIASEPTAPSAPNVLRQTGAYKNPDFPRVLIKGLTFTDLTLRVRCRPEVLALERVAAYDMDRAASDRFVGWARNDLKLAARTASSASDAARDADVVVTCTSSTQVVLEDADVGSGVFVAAVGADHEHKWEIDPRLLARSRVVVDNLNQCATIGDLHHAIEHGTMTREAIHSDLGSVVAAKRPGRESDDEVTLFDSTGIALEDAVTAALVLRRAVDQKLGTRFDFFA
ncbi:MAG: hypothetical protein ACREBE_02425 [bacterium]